MASIAVRKKEVTRDLDHCDIPYYVSEFVERELGNDYDSLGKLDSLIEKLSENKKQLEEQVSIFLFYFFFSSSEHFFLLIKNMKLN